jgi:hypothetical protein
LAAPWVVLLANLGLTLTGLLCLVYFGHIAYRTASARDLPGWIGLLVFVPIVNFFIYPCTSSKYFGQGRLLAKRQFLVST